MHWILISSHMVMIRNSNCWINVVKQKYFALRCSGEWIYSSKVQEPERVNVLRYLPPGSVSFQLDFKVHWWFCPSLQGSLDNISIIIVCFPGAPKVSQEALQQEAELEQQIDMKVEGDLLLKDLPQTPTKKTVRFTLLLNPLFITIVTLN